MSLSSLPPRTAWRAHSGLGLALALGLALRLALWGHLPRTGWISDEGEYFSAASWLAAGRNFGWYLGYLWTRAPLYPLFVAAHLRLFGETPTPVFASQMVLSLLNVVLVYALARCLVPANRQAATLAAVLMALYFPFAVYPQALLSETLFIALLLGAFLALAYAVATDHQPPTTDDRRPTANLLAGQRGEQVRWLVLAGGLMGLATLTRSITLAFLPVVALWLLAQIFPHRGSEGIESAKFSKTSVFSVSLWFGTSEMGFRRSELGGTMTSLGVVPFAFLCGLLLIAQPQFPIFDLQSPSALNRLHTGAPVPDLRSSISHLRSQAFRIPLAPCRFAAHAFLCVLCVSVVQFGTVTVIEGNSPQRRRVHREDLNPQMTTTPDSAQPCFPLCSLCLCGSAHRRWDFGDRSWGER